MCFLVRIKKIFYSLDSAEGFGSPISPQSLNFPITRLNCQTCGTSEGLNTLNSLRKALLTKITDLSSAYLVTIQIRCSDEVGDGLLGMVSQRLLQHFKVSRFRGLKNVVRSNTKQMRYCLLISDKYNWVKSTKTQLDLKALYLYILFISIHLLN